MWWLLETNRLPADQVKLLKVAGLEKTRLSVLDRLKRKKKLAGYHIQKLLK